MATYYHDEKWSHDNIRSATAGAAISNRRCVYLSAEDTIQHNSLSFQRVAGISRDSYDSGEKDVEYIVRGRIRFLSGSAIVVGDPLVPDSTAGRFRTAYKNEPGVVGHAVRPAAAAGDWCVGEFDFTNAEERDEVIYYNAAMTANVSPTLSNEAGTYLVKGCYIENSTANAVTGGLNIGTADDGAEIAATLTVGASGKYFYLPADMVAVAFTLTEDDELFFHAETAWNSASLIVKLILKRLY